MNEKTLREYIANIYRLESNKYALDALRERVSDRINRLKESQDIPEKEIEKVEYRSYLYLVILSIGVLWFLAVVAIVLWFALSIFNGLLYSLYDYINLFRIIPIGITVVLFVVACTWNSIRISQIRAQNRIIIEENKQIQRQNSIERMNTANALSSLNQQLVMIDSKRRETQRALSAFYGKNIIYEKYRNLIAISSFHEYFSSRRCVRLEGHEGAYNIFENEVRLNLIISKLDEAVKRLDQIQSNQYALYSTIQESNRKIGQISKQMFSMVVQTNEQLQNINENTAISTYYNSISAANSESEKWLLYNKLY